MIYNNDDDHDDDLIVRAGYLWTFWSCSADADITIKNYEFRVDVMYLVTMNLLAPAPVLWDLSGKGAKGKPFGAWKTLHGHRSVTPKTEERRQGQGHSGSRAMGLR